MLSNNLKNLHPRLKFEKEIRKIGKCEYVLRHEKNEITNLKGFMCPRT